MTFTFRTLILVGFAGASLNMVAHADTGFWGQNKDTAIGACDSSWRSAANQKTLGDLTLDVINAPRGRDELSSTQNHLKYWQLETEFQKCLFSTLSENNIKDLTSNQRGRSRLRLQLQGLLRKARAQEDADCKIDPSSSDGIQSSTACDLSTMREVGLSELDDSLTQSLASGSRSPLAVTNAEKESLQDCQNTVDSYSDAVTKLKSQSAAASNAAADGQR